MELKRETLAEQYQKALTYQQQILPVEFTIALKERDSKTLIKLIMAYPTFTFSMEDAFLVVGSIKDEAEAIEFLELLFINQRFRDGSFFDALQSMINAAVKGCQLNVLTFLLKKNHEFDSKGPRFRFVTQAKPRLTESVSQGELVWEREREGGRIEERTKPEYHHFFDTLVDSLLKEDPAPLEPFARELVEHYKDRTINLKPEILLSLTEQFFFSENNKNGLALVNNLLPWAVKNGHIKIASLFYRDTSIPGHCINEALSEIQSSTLYRLIIELYWPTIRCLLAAKSDENTLLGLLFIKELNNYIAGKFVFMQASPAHFYFFTSEKSIATAPTRHLTLIRDFLAKERTRLKNEYRYSNFVNNITNSLSGYCTFGDGYGNLHTDYPKPGRLQYIENYISTNMNRFSQDDIPVIIVLIHAVCAVRKHLLSGQPTSLTNFINFCKDNSFTCPTDAVLCEERLLELFKTDGNVKLALDEVKEAYGVVLKTNNGLIS